MRFRPIHLLVCALGLMMILSACASTPALTATAVPPTDVPTEIQPTATSTSVPVVLAGPDIGSKMLWMDGSSLVYIPSGEFQMGSGAPDAPVHAVSLDAFWIHTTKVTNRMYSQCVLVGSCTAPTQELGAPVYTNPDFANHPVVGVTWDQAGAYCAWAGGRLPSEAEWELTARGSAANPYPWGSDKPACDLLNFGNCFSHTTDVTAYELGASPSGAMDMAGNVFEWVNDWYDETYYTGSPASNPTGPNFGQFRGIRGSSFESEINQIQSSIRRYNEPLDHSRDIGFRCVVPQPEPYAFYCQLPPYIPSAAQASSTPTACEQPLPEVRGQYCVENYGYATVDLPEGASFEVLEKEFNCDEAVVDGQRRLTCRGPRAREVTGDISICNPTCTDSPEVTGATPVCPSGYTLDPNTQLCSYTPILTLGDSTSCPAGYVLVDRGGQGSCVIGLDANGLCPQMMYYDSLYGACVPANGQADAPYGIDDPALASQTYRGCAPGYSYDETTQCCQAASVTYYPGCAPGTIFNESMAACSPQEIKATTSAGCTTLAVTIPACGKPVDVCKRIDSETHCIQASYACRWDEKEGLCLLK